MRFPTSTYTIEKYKAKRYALSHNIKVIKTPESQVTFSKDFVHENEILGSRIYYAKDEYDREYMVKEYRLNGPKGFRKISGRAAVANKRIEALENFREDFERVRRLGRSFGPLGVCVNRANESQSTKVYSFQKILKATLPVLLRRLRGMPDISSLDIARFVILEIAQDLQLIHACKIIHFDVKPENVCVRGDKLELIDFDISGTGPRAKVRGSTRQYAPVEQRPGRYAGSAADIFALGVMMGELLQPEGVALLGNMAFTDPDLQVTSTRDVPVEDYLSYRSNVIGELDPLTVDHFNRFHDSLRTGSQELFDLFSRMVHSEESERPTIDQVVEALTAPDLCLEPEKILKFRRILEGMPARPEELEDYRDKLEAGIEHLKISEPRFWKRS